MNNKFTLLILLLSFSYACSDNIEQDQGWKFENVKDGSSDIPDALDALDVSPDVTVVKDVSQDVQSDVNPSDVQFDLEADASDDSLLLSDIKYMDLPTGAIRYSLSGFDPDAKVCVAVIVEFKSSGCFSDEENRPSLFILENATDSNCWDYTGTTNYTDSTGCVDFSQNTNDMKFTIDAPNYQKTVRFFE